MESRRIKRKLSPYLKDAKTWLREFLKEVQVGSRQTNISLGYLIKNVALEVERDGLDIAQWNCAEGMAVTFLQKTENATFGCMCHKKTK